MPWPLRSCCVRSSSVLLRERHLSVHMWLPWKSPWLLLTPWAWATEIYNLRKVLLCWFPCKPSSKQYWYRYFVPILYWISRMQNTWSWQCQQTIKWLQVLEGGLDGHGRGWGVYVLFSDERIFWGPLDSTGEGCSWSLCSSQQEGCCFWISQRKFQTIDEFYCKFVFFTSTLHALITGQERSYH